MFLVLLLLLGAAASASAQMAHGGMDHGAAGHGGGAANASAAPLPIPDACVQKPALANCTAFKYPHANAVADLESLCAAMPFMVACSVANACEAAGAGPANARGKQSANVSADDPQVCWVFNQVATVCKLDTGMSKMKGCANYNSMCVEGSVVEQCANMTGISSLPPTKTVNERLRSVCESMPHDGCAPCLASWKANKTWGECDLISAYSSVCSEMPDMDECVELHQTCVADKTLWFCRKFPVEDREAILLQLQGEAKGGANSTRGGEPAAAAASAAEPPAPAPAAKSAAAAPARALPALLAGAAALAAFLAW